MLSKVIRQLELVVLFSFPAGSQCRDVRSTLDELVVVLGAAAESSQLVGERRNPALDRVLEMRSNNNNN